MEIVFDLCFLVTILLSIVSILFLVIQIKVHREALESHKTEEFNLEQEYFFRQRQFHNELRRCRTEAVEKYRKHILEELEKSKKTRFTKEEIIDIVNMCSPIYKILERREKPRDEKRQA